VYTFGGSGPNDDATAGSAAQGPDGTVAVVGAYGGTAEFGGGKTATAGNQQREACLLKLGTDGSLSFIRSLKNTSDLTSSASANDVAIGQDASIYVVGAHYGKIDFDFDGAGDSQDAGSAWRAFASKYNSSGTRYWTKFIAGGSESKLGRIVSGVDGSLWMSGTFSGTADFDLDAGKNEATANTSDAFLLKLDVAGGFLKLWVWNGSSGAAPPSVALAGDGGVFVGGAFWDGSMDLDPGPGQDIRSTASDTDDAYLVRVKSDGSYAWGYHFGGAASEMIAGVVALTDGGVIITGSFGSSVNFAAPSGNDLRDPAQGSLFITKLGPNREYRWTISAGSSATSAAGIAVLKDGFSVAGGAQGSGDFDPGPSIDRVTVASGATGFVTRYQF
jgi:hypothetical protein